MSKPDKTKQPRTEVIVTDIDIKFSSLVTIMVKAALAVIPAGIILYVGGVLAMAFVGGILA